MAQIKEISFTFQCKKSDGNYGSLCFEATETTTLEPNDNIEAVSNDQRNRVVSRVLNEIHQIFGTPT